MQTIIQNPLQTHKHLQYIHHNSHHPNNAKTGLIKGELLRYKRQCSDPTEYNLQKQQLIHHFLDRGYPFKVIRKAIQAITDTATHHRTPTPKKIYPLILHYDARRLHPKQTLMENFNILQREPATFPLSKNAPLVAYKNYPNLGKKITRSPLDTDATKSTIPNTTKSYHIPLLPTPCQRRNCIICTSMTTTNTFKCTATNIRAPILNRLTCDSTSIIYVLQCQYCNLQYVGETTTPLRVRMANHRSAFRSSRQPRMLLYKHFDTHGTFNVKIIPLTHTHPSRRMTTEDYWINRLNTRIPNRLNDIYL